MTTRPSIYALVLTCLASVVAPQGALAANDDADLAYEDITETYGYVPGFFSFFAKDDIESVWHAFRLLQLNPTISVEAKTRELIGVAIASQGPCRPCLYFHAAAALANGASKEEIREVVGVGAATRRLDAFLIDTRVDAETFNRETNLLLWHDAATIERRGPSAGFCDFIIAWTDADYVGCE